MFDLIVRDLLFLNVPGAKVLINSPNSACCITVIATKITNDVEGDTAISAKCVQGQETQRVITGAGDACGLICILKRMKKLPDDGCRSLASIDNKPPAMCYRGKVPSAHWQW